MLQYIPPPLQFSSRGETSSSLDASLTFLVLGDWGGQESSPYTTPAEVELAGVMGKKASEIGSEFTLALGDNFYHEGVKDVHDKRFQQTFEVSSIVPGQVIITSLHLPKVYLQDLCYGCMLIAMHTNCQIANYKV